MSEAEPALRQTVVEDKKGPKATEENGSQNLQGAADPDEEGPAQKSGYQFHNYTGTQIRFCISDDELSEDMKLPYQRQGNLGTEKNQFLTELEKVIVMDGNFQNAQGTSGAAFRNHEEFEKQMADIKLKQQKSSEFQGIQDFIEDEPLTVDLKISGIVKRHHIPIERVGVHSYEAEGLCQEQDGQGGSYLVSKPVGLIVNVKTQGRKRVISFESQLLIANNNKLALTLVFKIK